MLVIHQNSAKVAKRYLRRITIVYNIAVILARKSLIEITSVFTQVKVENQPKIKLDISTFFVNGTAK